MPLALSHSGDPTWHVRKIAVVGPGIVGVPMATLLAHVGVRVGSDTAAPVVVIQRRSPTSGWKVDAINRGESPIGGIEPAMDDMLRQSVEAGRLSASYDYEAARDADVVLVCVQTDRDGNAPAYGPLFEAMTGLAESLRNKPKANIPLVIFESTLAPTSMLTVVRDHFARYDLVEGRDILLGNSPNRVMPGRLLERVETSDKLVAGLSPVTPGLIARLYGHIVTRGSLHQTTSLTAEIVKTLENAYRDVRIAFAAEVARYCDARDIDYYGLRDAVNARVSQSDDASRSPNAVPSGGLLIPTLGVGGHCLPKDGILLWWRALEAGREAGTSLILEARRINDESPGLVLEMMERQWGALAKRRVALLGTAYRFNSEDTRNSPTLPFGRLLMERGARLTLHDPFVKPTDHNLTVSGLQAMFTNELSAAVAEAELLVLCTAHREYIAMDHVLAQAPRATGIVDACNLVPTGATSFRPDYIGIGRGRQPASAELLDDVVSAFEAVERGVANELQSLIDFLNATFTTRAFERADLAEVRRLAATCGTGCRIPEPGPPARLTKRTGFSSRLADRASAR